MILVFILINNLFITYQNYNYAKNYYSKLFEYDKVLESRKWHPLLNNSAFDCTYAIVSLNNRPSNKSSWKNINWKNTPAQISHDKINIASECAKYFSESTNHNIKKILSESGSYYYDDSDTIYIFSEKYKFSAYIRYGD